MNRETHARVAPAPVKKCIDLDCPIEAAFEVFTGRLATWWPLMTHSCFGDSNASVQFEERVGGHVWEIAADGRRAAWGEILEWQPPHSFVMTWHPGNTADVATRLSVRFESLAPSRSRLNLVHEAWEARGADAASARDAYQSGWDPVLGRYAECVAKAGVR